MAFYILTALFPALFVDIWLANFLYKRSRKVLSAFASVPLYIINAFIWASILSATNPAYSGQGAVDLLLIVGLGVLFSVIRLLWGIMILIDRRK